MKNLDILKIMESYIVASLGGYSFYITHLPLPWILGPISLMLIWKSATRRELISKPVLNNGGLAILGIYFGLFFTKSTFMTVTPFVVPFLLLTFLLIMISVLNSILVSRYISVDPVTSVFGSIPGGLAEMVAASESLKANTSMVVVFQTVRLLTVVFTVPFIVVHLFVSKNAVPLTVTQVGTENILLYLWFIPGVFLGWILRKKLPAPYVIGPLLFTAILGVNDVTLAPIPVLVLIAAQVTVGMFMGSKITIQDIKLGGKYSGIYFVMTMVLILISFGMGYLFTLFTPISLKTALLSFAPGGIVEMVLTANSIGADPAIVSSLQLIRLLVIIIFVPSVLKWFFHRKAKKSKVG